MANSSILGGTRAPAEPAGKDIDSLGPSDTSDSGSDVRTDPPRNVSTDESSEGALSTEHGSTGDAAGTGERASSDAREPALDSDLLPDRIGQIPPGSTEANLDPDDLAAPDELAADEDEDEEGTEGRAP